MNIRWKRHEGRCKLCNEKDTSGAKVIARFYGMCDECFSNPKGDSFAKKLDNKEIIVTPDGPKWKPRDVSHLIEYE